MKQKLATDQVLIKKCPLPRESAILHDHTMAFASIVQRGIAKDGGCKTAASEALNVLTYTAILTHRAARSLCEDGWTPVAPLLVRTLLDIFASCIAIVAIPADANFMGFKYLAHFFQMYLKEPNLSDDEQKDAEFNLAKLVTGLPTADQTRANDLIKSGIVQNYWFQPEYQSTKALLNQSSVPIYGLYRILSAITHGGFSAKLLFNDFPTSEDIEPRDHPKAKARMIVASSRLLAEICYVRDQFDNGGVNAKLHAALLQEINSHKA